MLISRFIPAAANGMISFFKCLSGVHSLCISKYIFFIHSCLDGQLGCSHVLAIASFAAVNIGVHESFEGIVFFQISAQDWNCWIKWKLCFRFLRHCHTVFHSGCPGSCSSNGVGGFPSPPHALQHLLFIKCLMTAIGVGVSGPPCSVDLPFSTN